MHSHDKAAFLKGLKSEKEAMLQEQAGYRAILRGVERSSLSTIPSSQIDAVDWDAVEKNMAGECWPPTSKDWLEIKGLQHYETPKQKLLNLIADEDIRFHMYHYSELADHTKRIKAAAHFYSVFGTVRDDVAMAFTAWKECSKIKFLNLQTCQLAPV